MANAKANLLTQYQLCRRCFKRQKGRGRRKQNKQCFICRDLMDNLDFIIEKISMSIEDYEFKTFLVGATLPTQLYEREDTVRARLKIRGLESIKNHLTREIGIGLSQSLKKNVDYLKPDITINLMIDKENNTEVTVKSRPLLLFGRYLKKSRGLPQKQDRCINCEGKGCDSCSHTGLSGYNSVEGIIAKELVRLTRGVTPKFSWIGGEDQGSLVLGSGRPFYVRIFNPKKRKIDKNKIRSDGIVATMKLLTLDDVDQGRSFKVKTKVHVRCEKELTRQDMDKVKSISGIDITYENKAKPVTKKIQLARAHLSTSNEFELTMVADGGLMIKQFVGGEEFMKPNVSEILGAKCECITFDILDVIL